MSLFKIDLCQDSEARLPLENQAEKTWNGFRIGRSYTKTIPGFFLLIFKR
jgi:hypothetical protein